MSYRRWSTDDFHCDIYAYSSDDGIVIHVAARRARFTSPLPPPVRLSAATAFEWAARNAKVSAMLKDAEREWIDLPHAGSTFIEPGAAQAANRLRELAGLGFRVPQRVIDDLDAQGAREVLAT